ncbi:MAG: stalk domain-containing protein [Aminipila sp.]
MRLEIRNIKWIPFILVIVLFIGLLNPITASAKTQTLSARTETASAKTEIDGIKVDINGEFVQFTYSTGFPFVDINNRTQVPFRAAMEAYGCTVSWDDARQVAIAEKDGIIVEVPVGQYYIRKNGFEYITDTAAILQNSRVYLPIRPVLEAFYAEVGWNQATQTVMVASSEKKDDLVKIHFIDVGHGDSIFIDIGKYEILIDGGVTSTGAIVSEYIRPYVDESLDLLVTTHSHMDHVGGLPEIFKYYQIDRVIESGSSLNTPEWLAYEEAKAQQPDCNITYDEDEVISITDKIQLKIIEALDNQDIENNNSVVSLLQVGDISVLFTGDSQAEAESVILQKVGKVDVFKGAHHGSFNANRKELLDVIQPEYIVISAGRGMNYNHPHAAAMKRMLATEAIIYGTFKSGTVVMTTDGKAYSLSSANIGRGLIPLQLSDAGTYQNNID